LSIITCCQITKTLYTNFAVYIHRKQNTDNFIVSFKIQK
jgi:hypothetical protein